MVSRFSVVTFALDKVAWVSGAVSQWATAYDGVDGRDPKKDLTVVETGLHQADEIRDRIGCMVLEQL
jgi:hypothetical protein